MILIIIGAYAKRWPKCARIFPNRNWRRPISDSEDLSIGMILRGKNGAAGLISEEKALCAELNERAEAATSSYSATGDFLQYIYPFTLCLRLRIIRHNFNDINHGYGAAVSKKNSLWMLPFYIAVAT